MPFTLEDVSFGYRPDHPILHHVYLSLAEGEFVLLQGPSGSGKSTLLRLLNRLLVPQAGEIFFHRQPLASYDPVRLRRRVSYLQQTPVMIEASVRENLLLPFFFKSARHSPVPSDHLLQEYLRAFLLEGVSLEDNARQLSLGQQQRLALIRSLLLRPEVLLLDEPTASLDPVSRQVVEERAEALNLEEGVTVIMISHAAYAPRRIHPRVLRLQEQRLKEVQV